MATTNTTAKPATDDPVKTRVTKLRRLAGSDPQAAQDATWAWFERVGAGLPSPEAEIELDGLFRTGKPGESIDGQTEGIVVGWVEPDPEMDGLGRTIQAFARELTGRTTPWLGKRFDREAKRGTNSVTAIAHLTRLFAPTYGLKSVGDHYEAFEMRNWVEPSRLDPATDVLVIDYQQGNPWPMTKIRDELVEIVPGTYLGKMIYCQDDGEKLWAYFALKTPVEV